MAATQIAQFTPGAVGTWLVSLHLAITSTIPPTLIATGGLPYFTLTFGSQGHTFVLPAAATAKTYPVEVAFLYEIASDSEQITVDGEAFQMPASHSISIDLAADAVLVGLPTDDGSPQAGSVIVKPGSKLQIHRSGGV